MTDSTATAAIHDWYTLDAEQPALLGSRCQACGTYAFPKTIHICKNPACNSQEFDEVELSRTGTVWSYTNACYQPPEPFVASDPFEPFTIAAVELEREQMTVLGQVVEGVSVEDLRVGMEMELVLEPLYTDDEGEKLIWKWRPATANQESGHE